MRFIALLLIFASLVSCPGRAQQAPIPAARVVLVFESDPKFFSALLLDNSPFAKLTFPQDRATVWPAPAGTRKLTAVAEGAESKELNLNLQPGNTYLLTLGIVDLPHSQAGAPSKKIEAAIATLPLPSPDASVRSFVYLAPSAKTVRGELIKGSSSRDGSSKSAPIDLVPGKLLPLGTGRFSLLVGGKLMAFLSSTSPGLFVYLLFPDHNGGLKPRSFTVFSNLDKEEDESSPRP